MGREGAGAEHAPGDFRATCCRYCLGCCLSTLRRWIVSESKSAAKTSCTQNDGRVQREHGCTASLSNDCTPRLYLIHPRQSVKWVWPPPSYPSSASQRARDPSLSFISHVAPESRRPCCSKTVPLLLTLDAGFAMRWRPSKYPSRVRHVWGSGMNPCDAISSDSAAMQHIHVRR